MRPRGDVRLALAQAWDAGPAPVREAAQRACVGMAVARYTASRMVDSGELVVVQPGKPAVLARPVAAPSAADAVTVVDALDLLQSFWERPVT